MNVTYTNGPPRTGSYPLMNIAKDYDVPVELVWQYAWNVKKRFLEIGHIDEVSVSGELYGLICGNTNGKGVRLVFAIEKKVVEFCKLQGSALDKPNVEIFDVRTGKMRPSRSTPHVLR